jgi:hypothetical protein
MTTEIKNYYKEISVSNLYIENCKKNMKYVYIIVLLTYFIPLIFKISELHSFIFSLIISLVSTIIVANNSMKKAYKTTGLTNLKRKERKVALLNYQILQMRSKLRSMKINRAEQIKEIIEYFRTCRIKKTLSEKIKNLFHNIALPFFIGVIPQFVIMKYSSSKLDVKLEEYIIVNISYVSALILIIYVPIIIIKSLSIFFYGYHGEERIINRVNLILTEILLKIRK